MTEKPPDNVIEMRFVHEKCGKPYREHTKLIKKIRGRRKVIAFLCPQPPPQPPA